MKTVETMAVQKGLLNGMEATAAARQILLAFVKRRLLLQARHDLHWIPPQHVLLQLFFDDNGVPDAAAALPFLLCSFEAASSARQE